MNKPVSLPVAPWDPAKPMPHLVARVFSGKLDAGDLDCIGRGVLQMADEHHEMREQIRLLQLAVRELTGAK